ncbi:cytochrome P450 [Kitasatospora azatica]|uniref:cytochrome P450 n=1 Tax=Kitasatospora azatica TaxID=58347 RepID=UPI00056455C6|nr:cytochrome P450 [Kitasatospora azatica]
MAAPPAVEAARLVLQLRSAEDQAAVHARLAELGPVHMMPWKAVVVTSYAACRKVMTDPAYATVDATWRDRITPGWRANQSLVTLHSALPTTNPPSHACLRRTLTAGLSPTAAAALRPQLTAAAERCLDDLAAALAADGTTDLVPVLAERLPMEILCTWLGLPTGDAGLLAGLTRRWSVAYELGPSPEQLADADRAHQALHEYLRPHLMDRHHAPTDDTLSRWLLPAPRGGGLDTTRVLTNTTVLLLGAKDLSALITAAVHTLLTDPSLAGGLREGTVCAAALGAEIARLRPPVGVVTRVATRDTLLAGVPVEAGSLVHALIGPANRDPARANTMLTFGAGMHYCPGAPLTRLHLQTLLPLIARCFPALRLAEPLPRSTGVAFPHLPRLLVTEAPRGRKPRA